MKPSARGHRGAAADHLGLAEARERRPYLELDPDAEFHRMAKARKNSGRASGNGLLSSGAIAISPICLRAQKIAALVNRLRLRPRM